MKTSLLYFVNISFSKFYTCTYRTHNEVKNYVHCILSIYLPVLGVKKTSGLMFGLMLKPFNFIMFGSTLKSISMGKNHGVVEVIGTRFIFKINFDCYLIYPHSYTFICAGLSIHFGNYIFKINFNQSIQTTFK